MSKTWTKISASLTSSNVDLKDSISCFGSFLIKPTVSVSSIGKFPKTTFLTVVSRVAKSLFSAKTLDFDRTFIKVLLPTFVYPTNATRTSCPLFPRCVCICLSISFRRSFIKDILCPMIRRSVSICDSPGPRIPIPPFCRSRCVHILVNRGNMY